MVAPWLLIAAGLVSCAALCVSVEGARRQHVGMGCLALVIGAVGFWLLAGGVIAWALGV